MTGTERELEREAGVQTTGAVTVEIYDQLYTLRGPDTESIAALAAKVDTKMRAVAERGGTVDSLRVAVLAAVNLADELEMMRQRYEELRGSLQQAQRSVRSMGSRAGSLGTLLDETLDGAAEGEQQPSERRAG